MISETICRQAKILIVDDEKANVRLLEVILQEAGYADVHSTTDSRQVLSMFEAIHPDLLLLDLTMPYLDGFEVMGKLRPFISENHVPILVLTADASSSVKHRALKEGARDFLTKPFDETEVLLRIYNLLETRFHNVLLEQTVRERTQDFQQAQWETVQRLALAAEYRDDETGLHAKRVGAMSGRIAEILGLSRTQVDLIRRAAPLHDVGKIGIPDAILRKPGKLTPEEFAWMKRHTVIGALILSGSSSPLLKMAEEIALYHHERWDGTGYAGLRGEDIPLSGRIVCIADTFDALSHERPYKKAWPVEDAIVEITLQRCRQFDPAVVDAFLRLVESNTWPNEPFVGETTSVPLTRDG